MSSPELERLNKFKIENSRAKISVNFFHEDSPTLTHNARHNVTSQNHIACLKLFMRSEVMKGAMISPIFTDQ